MLRTVTLAVLAAAVLSGAANAHEVRISLASKSSEEVKVAVAAAARSVCLSATATETFRVEALNRCVKDTIDATMAQMSGAKAEQLAQR